MYVSMYVCEMAGCLSKASKSIFYNSLMEATIGFGRTSFVCSDSLPLDMFDFLDLQEE